MATITKNDTVSIDANTARRMVSGLFAAEELAAGIPCQLESDGVHPADSATGTYIGFNVKHCNAGEPVSLFRGVFDYSASQTAGTLVYLSATAGTLEDAPQATGYIAPVGIFVDSTDLLVF